MVVQVPTLEPTTPEWFKRWTLRAMQFFVPVIPQQPQKLFSLPTASLPPAANYPKCLMYDETLNKVIFSDGTTWTAL